MKIVNDKALDFARGPGWCDYCRRPVKARNPHHVYSKGAGGPDIRCNIAAICETFSGGLNCHQMVHSGEIDDDSILAMVADRENVLQGDIEDLVNLIRYRMPPIRDVTEWRFMAYVSKLNTSAQRLAIRELKSFRHLLRKD